LGGNLQTHIDGKSKLFIIHVTSETTADEMKQLVVDTFSDSSIDEYDTLLHIESTVQFSYDHLRQIGVALKRH
jgi:hypothetical protein